MLDPIGRAEVLETIDRLRAEGMTIVMITHYMDEAARADRVVVMNGGKIVREGKPREVFSDVRFLEKIGLEVPTAVELARRLKLKNVLTIEELEQRLRR